MIDGTRCQTVALAGVSSVEESRGQRRGRSGGMVGVWTARRTGGNSAGFLPSRTSGPKFRTETAKVRHTETHPVAWKDGGLVDVNTLLQLLEWSESLGLLWYVVVHVSMSPGSWITPEVDHRRSPVVVRN